MTEKKLFMALVGMLLACISSVANWRLVAAEPASADRIHARDVALSGTGLPSDGEWLVGIWKVESVQHKSGTNGYAPSLTRLIVFPFSDWRRWGGSDKAPIAVELRYVLQSGKEELLPLTFEEGTITDTRLFIGDPMGWRFSYRYEELATKKLLTLSRIMNDGKIEFVATCRKVDSNPGTPLYPEWEDWNRHFPERRMWEARYRVRNGLFQSTSQRSDGNARH